MTQDAWATRYVDVRDSRGPERIGGPPDPDYKPPPFLGFSNRATDPDEDDDTMPDLWEGDQA